jgi:succinate dehydrogenase/fumarate reductase flavoprotein subunit
LKENKKKTTENVEKKQTDEVSRRNFLLGAGTVVVGGVIGGGLLASCKGETTVTKTVEIPTTKTISTTVQVPTTVVSTVQAPASTVTTTKTSTVSAQADKFWLPSKWDYEYDIVCIGGGGASASCAISATDLGAKVLILEKAPEIYQGGNTSVSGGEVYSHQNIEDFIKYLTGLNGAYVMDPAYVRKMAEMMADNGNYMNTTLDCQGLLGLEVTWRAWEEFPELDGVANSGCWIVGPKGADSGYGKQLWDLYKANIDKRKIDMWFESPAKHLIQNPQTKEIIGVIAEKQGTTVYIKAKKAVLLACGGFNNNQDMHKDFLHRISGYPKGTPYSTGDGIKMALEVGADLWHCGNSAGPLLEFVDTETGIRMAGSPGSNTNCIHVGADGTRFVNEAESQRHGKVMRHGQWEAYPTPLPVHAIFDHTAFSARALGDTTQRTSGLGWNPIKGVYMWSADNSVEVAKGWIKKADTIRELAVLIGKDPDILEATVNKWNQSCANGVDEEFGRPANRLFPVETAPFYAMELFPTYYNTQGGPRRNLKTEILDPFGNPIPRLYGGGELGSPFAHQYNGGMNNGDAMAFGRITAQEAVALQPWV